MEAKLVLERRGVCFRRSPSAVTALPSVEKLGEPEPPGGHVRKHPFTGSVGACSAKARQSAARPRYQSAPDVVSLRARMVSDSMLWRLRPPEAQPTSNTETLSACSEFSVCRCGSNMQCNRVNSDKPIDPDLLPMILCLNAS
jgi:hypothetical protein